MKKDILSWKQHIIFMICRVSISLPILIIVAWFPGELTSIYIDINVTYIQIHQAWSWRNKHRFSSISWWYSCEWKTSSWFNWNSHFVAKQNDSDESCCSRPTCFVCIMKQRVHIKPKRNNEFFSEIRGQHSIANFD